MPLANVVDDDCIAALRQFYQFKYVPDLPDRNHVEMVDGRMIPLGKIVHDLSAGVPSGAVSDKLNEAFDRHGMRLVSKADGFLRIDPDAAPHPAWSPQEFCQRFKELIDGDRQSRGMLPDPRINLERAGVVLPLGRLMKALAGPSGLNSTFVDADMRECLKQNLYELVERGDGRVVFDRNAGNPARAIKMFTELTEDGMIDSFVSRRAGENPALSITKGDAQVHIYQFRERPGVVVLKFLEVEKLDGEYLKKFVGGNEISIDDSRWPVKLDRICKVIREDLVADPTERKILFGHAAVDLVNASVISTLQGMVTRNPPGGESAERWQSERAEYGLRLTARFNTYRECEREVSDVRNQKAEKQSEERTRQSYRNLGTGPAMTSIAAAASMGSARHGGHGGTYREPRGHDVAPTRGRSESPRRSPSR
ncbi:hypothetical protein ACIBEF_32310 [Micromonospora sp. NPDC050795]|uniref:hypothetical protein n=1 Tax=Micromonospora sp. NPDC050795 TaxID=3364282 RepID=UPI0037A106CA